jgi:hypothetical protein
MTDYLIVIGCVLGSLFVLAVAIDLALAAILAWDNRRRR